MSEPHKRSYRHPKYKTAYRVSNWPKYEKSLRDRGDVTLWICEDAIKRDGRPRWKRESGYYRQSHAENAFFRYKTILGGRLRTKKSEAQERDVAIGCAVLNRMLEMGCSQSYPMN